MSILSKFQLSKFFRFGIDSVLKIFGLKPVYRTAPVTPGLLITNVVRDLFLKRRQAQADRFVLSKRVRKTRFRT